MIRRNTGRRRLLAVLHVGIIPLLALLTLLMTGDSVHAAGSFNPNSTGQYCAEGSAQIDKQQIGVTACTPSTAEGSHPDVVGTFDISAPDYNFGGVVNFTPTAPDDNAIPVGAVLGDLGTAPTLGLVNNACNNDQIKVPFTFIKGTTDINDTVTPQPFGQSNDLAPMSGDSNGDGVPEVKPPPAATKYPSFLNAIFDPDWVDFGPDKIAGNGDDNNGPQPAIKPVFRAVATTSISAAGRLWVVLQLVVFDKGTKIPNFPPIDPGYGYPSVVVLQTSSGAGSATPVAPSAVTDFCSPLRTVNVSYGVTHDNPDTPANEGGIPVRTLPAAGTQIVGVSYGASQRDADGDGFENALDPCPTTPDTVWNPRIGGTTGQPTPGDSDVFTGVASPDGIPDSCDPTPNEPTAGPPANQPSDHDGDGFPNRGDNCPLVANAGQEDTDKNEAGEEVGDGIGDACDPNPGTPDGAEIKCIKTSVVTVGGDPNVQFSPCLTDLPPLGAGGVPDTSAVGGNAGDAAGDTGAGTTAGRGAAGTGGGAAGGAGGPASGVGSLSPVGGSVPAWAAIAAALGAAGVIGSLGTMASRLIKRRRDI